MGDGHLYSRCKHGFAAVRVRAPISEHSTTMLPRQAQSQEPRGKVEHTPDGTHRARKVKSYWEGCWGIGFFLCFLPYWPVQKFLVCVQTATTRKENTVSMKRDASRYHVRVSHSKERGQEEDSIWTAPCPYPQSAALSACGLCWALGRAVMKGTLASRPREPWV